MTDIQQDGRARRQQDIFDLNRTKLIDKAVDVINEVGDIREVTLTQIAKEAGVSPATAYNHFPDRMEDVFSAIVHARMDVAANMGATLADESLSVIEKLKQIPVTYAENLVSLGYAGKVIVVIRSFCFNFCKSFTTTCSCHCNFCACFFFISLLKHFTNINLNTAI